MGALSPSAMELSSLSSVSTKKVQLSRPLGRPGVRRAPDGTGASWTDGRDTGLWDLIPGRRRGALGFLQPGGCVAKPKVEGVLSWCQGHWEAESTAARLGLRGFRSLPLLFSSLSTRVLQD